MTSRMNVTLLALKGEPDGVRRGSRAFDAFGVIVGDGGYFVGSNECRIQVVPVEERCG